MDWKHYPTKNNYRLVFSPISTAAIHKISIPIAAAYKRFLYLKNLAMAEKDEDDGDNDCFDSFWRMLFIWQQASLHSKNPLLDEY